MGKEEERYIDWKLLAKGGFGAVYRVFDTMLKQRVAVKLLREEHGRSEVLVEALHKEVKISRFLRHACICPIHDVYQGPRGVGIVMDFIDGIELTKWQEEHKGRLLDTAEARLGLLRKLTEALAYAHSAIVKTDDGVELEGIVHRDLKPDNIFLLKGDPSRPVIMDFGTAVIGEMDENTAVAGTPKYMSPEQWHSPKDVDKRADLFSLGILAYELFTDKIPETTQRYIMRYFKKGETPPQIKINLADIPPPSSFCAALPSSLDRIVLQLNAYRPEDRPPSAQEVLDALAYVELRSGDVIRDMGRRSYEALESETVLLKGGRFYLGSKTGQAHSMDHEKPRKPVELSPFRIGKYPVTVREYRAFVETTGYAPPPLLDDPQFGFDDHPVVGVSCEDALAYGRWAGGTLPTEAQWEYAAKGDRPFPLYPWGEEAPTSVRANIDGVSSATSSVAGCPSGVNPFGLYDLCGNVWEWCLDTWSPDYYKNLLKNAVDPTNTTASADRVLRGGAFDSFSYQGRCSARFHAPSGSVSRSIGFRLVFPA